MGLSIALVHFPTVNKKGRAVATSVTNFDIHDIARAAKTFGVERFFLVTPIAMQHDFIRRVIRYWVEEEGANYNPTSGELSFTVSGYYRDKNGDDDFTWEVWYTILALG